jgi:hypothetical protein
MARRICDSAGKIFLETAFMAARCVSHCGRRPCEIAGRYSTTLRYPGTKSFDSGLPEVPWNASGFACITVALLDSCFTVIS